jgi:hypothetical protein
MAPALRSRRKFLRFFPGGFHDETYLDWERSYKWQVHLLWREALGRDTFRGLLRARRFPQIAALAVRVEQRSRHSMIFSFEKMALRDAVKSAAGRTPLPKVSTSCFTAVARSSAGSSAGYRWWPVFRASRRACSPGRC